MPRDLRGIQIFKILNSDTEPVYGGRGFELTYHEFETEGNSNRGKRSISYGLHLLKHISSVSTLSKALSHKLSYLYVSL